jgi:hypothetical protein
MGASGNNGTPATVTTPEQVATATARKAPPAGARTIGTAESFGNDLDANSCMRQLDKRTSNSKTTLVAAA